MRSVCLQIRTHQFATVQWIQQFGEAVECTFVFRQIECPCDVAKSSEIPRSQNQQMRLSTESCVDKPKRSVVKLGTHWFSAVEIRHSFTEFILGHTFSESPPPKSSHPP